METSEETDVFLVWSPWIQMEWVSWISEMVSSIWDVYVFSSTMVLLCFLYFDFQKCLWRRKNTGCLNSDVSHWRCTSFIPFAIALAIKVEVSFQCPSGSRPRVPGDAASIPAEWWSLQPAGVWCHLVPLLTPPLCDRGLSHTFLGLNFPTSKWRGLNNMIF